MLRIPRPAAAAALVLASACVSTPLRQIPPTMPEAGEGVMVNAANGGRVQSIAVNPTDRRNAIIAMQFGGMWKTYNAGKDWFRVYSLPAVHVTDVAYGADGKTVVATVSRDNRTQAGGGGGIYVSRDNGDSWSRPPTGIVPLTGLTSRPNSAYSVSRAPDERSLWYAATDSGVATSLDNGATWRHAALGTSSAQSVLAFSAGRVLAMDRNAVWRSNDHGLSWRIVINDDFSQFAPLDGMIGMSGNKMDRAPNRPWAFIFKSFARSPANGSGRLWFYELDTGIKTLLALPQGKTRGPFVRVSRDELFGGDHIRLWVGVGLDGYYVVRDDAASIRALLSTPAWDDWTSFIAEAGIHADTGDLGLDAALGPALLGTDGGIYKPRPQAKWWDKGGQHKWMSAARPGSGMNSLQITDLAGTNFHRANGSVTTSLYITTQDNKFYTSWDGGANWRVGDDREGFGLEGPADAAPFQNAPIAWVSRGAPDRFADANVTNPRPVPNLDLNGVALVGFQNPYYAGRQPGGNATHWVRRRVAGDLPLTEVHFSNNSGLSWRKFATANFKFAGEVRTVGSVAWLPVFLGGAANEVALVPMSIFPGIPIPVYDDSDVVRPPGGSLGQRYTEFDTHAVYGVHPTNWAYVIAPDIIANDVKVTGDGGKTWHTSPGLTAQVVRGGALRMWGGRADFMQVTEIAFDPYNPRRILVGTRDAGIACTADGGRTWRTIYDSDKIQYITGFHFEPGGAVYISSYGHGLWRLEPGSGCRKTYKFPWDVTDDFNLATELTGSLAAAPLPPRPRGIAAPDRPKLFLALRDAERGTDRQYLEIAGRGFAPSQDLVLQSREIPELAARARSDAKGRFSTVLALPEAFPHGTFTIEARGQAGPLTASEFRKPFGDEEEERERGARGEPKD